MHNPDAAAAVYGPRDVRRARAVLQRLFRRVVYATPESADWARGTRRDALLRQGTATGPAPTAALLRRFGIDPTRGEEAAQAIFIAFGARGL